MNHIDEEEFQYNTHSRPDSRELRRKMKLEWMTEESFQLLLGIAPKMGGIAQNFLPRFPSQ